MHNWKVGNIGILCGLVINPHLNNMVAEVISIPSDYDTSDELDVKLAFKVRGFSFEEKIYSNVASIKFANLKPLPKFHKDYHEEKELCLENRGKGCP